MRRVWYAIAIGLVVAIASMAGCRQSTGAGSDLDAAGVVAVTRTLDRFNEGMELIHANPPFAEAEAEASRLRDVDTSDCPEDYREAYSAATSACETLIRALPTRPTADELDSLRGRFDSAKARLGEIANRYGVHRKKPAN